MNKKSKPKFKVGEVVTINSEALLGMDVPGLVFAYDTDRNAMYPYHLAIMDRHSYGNCKGVIMYEEELTSKLDKDELVILALAGQLDMGLLHKCAKDEIERRGICADVRIERLYDV